MKVDFDNKICVLLKIRRCGSVLWLDVRSECVALVQCVIRIRIFELEHFFFKKKMTSSIQHIVVQLFQTGHDGSLEFFARTTTHGGPVSGSEIKERG